MVDKLLSLGCVVVPLADPVYGLLKRIDLPMRLVLEDEGSAFPIRFRRIDMSERCHGFPVIGRSMGGRSCRQCGADGHDCSDEGGAGISEESLAGDGGHGVHLS